MTHVHAFPSWPFSDPLNTGVFTTRQVMEGEHPVLEVYHDHDGDWQFLCGTTLDPEDLKLVCFGCMAEIAPDILELATLPLGWCAARESREGAWEREAFEAREEEGQDSEEGA